MNPQRPICSCSWDSAGGTGPRGICPFTKVMRLSLPLFMDLLLHFKCWMHPWFFSYMGFCWLWLNLSQAIPILDKIKLCLNCKLTFSYISQNYTNRNNSGNWALVRWESWSPQKKCTGLTNSQQALKGFRQVDSHQREETECGYQETEEEVH